MTTAVAAKKKIRGHLATPLTKYERWLIGKLYKENIGLVKYFGQMFIRKYPGVSPVEIYSCIDIAFVKAGRIWKPEKGQFSTVLYTYVSGEIRHFVRSNAYWGYSVTREVRELGMEARMMMAYKKVPMFALPKILGCTEEQLKIALTATLSVSYNSDLMNLVGEEDQDSDSNYESLESYSTVNSESF